MRRIEQITEGPGLSVPDCLDGIPHALHLGDRMRGSLAFRLWERTQVG